VLRVALLRALRRPRLLLGLWLLTLLIAAGAGLPVLLSLRSLLDERPLAAALARGQADFLWGEIFGDHPLLAAALAGSLLAAALPAWVLSAAMAGGVLDALRRPGDPRRVTGWALLARAGQTAPAMLRLWVLGLLLRLPLLAVLGGAAVGLRHALAGRGMVPALVGGGALLAVAALLWSGLSVALDYARLERLGDGATGPGAARRALRRGLRRARQAPGATLGLAALSALGLGLLALAGRSGALRLDDVAAPIVLVFAWRQLMALGRTTLQLTVLAGAVEVSHAQQAP
jgi:hypothetical protein